VDAHPLNIRQAASANFWLASENTCLRKSGLPLTLQRDKSRTHGACPAAGEPAVLFLSANTARHPAGICAGIGSNRRQKWFQIQMVMALGNYRPGAPRKKL
jgi:hypothetical protein